MDQLVNQFISLLKLSDFADIKSFYQSQSQSIQTQILLFLAIQANKNNNYYDYFQTLSVNLSEGQPMPVSLVSQVKEIERLKFFTPLLKTMAHFTVQDEKKRNVLHYLFVARGQPKVVPFTYIRSLLLFESNLFLPKALTQTESNNLTPLECYLHLNIQGNILPYPELTAFLALIEIEQTQRPVNTNSLGIALSRFHKQKRDFRLDNKFIDQKALLLASYYGVSVQAVLKKI